MSNQGKPNQNIYAATLRPLPAFEDSFSRVIVDWVGPLPKTIYGNLYLVTIMCASTRFPEAIPLRNIKAKTIIKALTILVFLLWVFLNQFSQIRDPIVFLIYFSKLCMN
jgi:hypothetical protein